MRSHYKANQVNAVYRKITSVKSEVHMQYIKGLALFDQNSVFQYYSMLYSAQSVHCALNGQPSDLCHGALSVLIHSQTCVCVRLARRSNPPLRTLTTDETLRQQYFTNFQTLMKFLYGGGGK